MSLFEQPRSVRFSWMQVDEMNRALATQIVMDGFSPDVIVGILRGGCVPAVHLAHLLQVRTMYAVLFQTTLSDEVRAPRTEPRLLAELPPEAVRDRKVLLVDDVINTGLTMQSAVQIVRAHNPSELKTAVLVWDTLAPDGLNLIPSIRCDYWIQYVDAWVTFPWND